MQMDLPDADVPLRKDARENRRRLLSAARTIFAEQGLEAGVDEVATTAGVGMGTLYRRFPTKNALVDELVKELLAEVLELADTAATAEDGGGLEQFLFAAGAAHAANRGCLPRLWTAPGIEALRLEVRKAMTRLLVDAQHHGHVRQDASLTDIELLFWSWRGLFEYMGDHAEPAWRRQTALVLSGLRPASGPIAEPAVDVDHMSRMTQTIRPPQCHGRT
jgi:AcrR family transcriptional regulator